jgi:hypothetical protein
VLSCPLVLAVSFLSAFWHRRVPWLWAIRTALLLNDLQASAQEQQRRQRVLSLIQPSKSQSFPQRPEEVAEESTMSLQRDKVEWELPHFKEAHQMQVSDMEGPSLYHRSVC